jgi:hypothetical protein
MASHAEPGWRLAVFRGAIHSALAVTTQCLHGVRWNAASSSHFSVLPGALFYQAFFVNERRRPTDPRARASCSGSPASSTAGSTAAPAVPDTPISGATSLVGETVERDVRVETPNVVAVFTSRGARLKSWRLKHYRDNQGESLELVANDVAGQPLPFSLNLADAATTASLNGGLYAVKGAPDPATVLTAPAQIAFEYRDSSGLTSTKRFTLDPAGYTLVFDAAIAQNDRPLVPTIVWGPASATTIRSRFGRPSVPRRCFRPREKSPGFKPPRSKNNRRRLSISSTPASTITTSWRSRSSLARRR